MSTLNVILAPTKTLLPITDTVQDDMDERVK